GVLRILGSQLELVAGTPYLTLLIEKDGVVVACPAVAWGGTQGSLKHGVGALPLPLALIDNRHGLECLGIVGSALQGAVEGCHGARKVVAFQVGHAKLGKGLGRIRATAVLRLAGTA